MAILEGAEREVTSADEGDAAGIAEAKAKAVSTLREASDLVGSLQGKVARASLFLRELSLSPAALACACGSGSKVCVGNVYAASQIPLSLFFLGGWSFFHCWGGAPYRRGACRLPSLLGGADASRGRR